MTPPLSEAHSELLQNFHSEKVRYLIVGGYAVITHGYPRMTRDLDLWIDNSEENITAIVQAVEKSGATIPAATRERMLSPGQVIVLGQEPDRIDLLTSLPEQDFDTCHGRCSELSADGHSLPVISLADLREAKKRAGRFQDLADLENLPEA